MSGQNSQRPELATNQFLCPTVPVQLRFNASPPGEGAIRIHPSGPVPFDSINQEANESPARGRGGGGGRAVNGAAGGEAGHLGAADPVQAHRQPPQEPGRRPPQVPQLHHRHCSGKLRLPLSPPFG